MAQGAPQGELNRRPLAAYFTIRTVSRQEQDRVSIATVSFTVLCVAILAVMDPLSIIVSIVGIVEAGTTVASSLYTLVQTVRHAPKEMKAVAKEMQNLNLVLEHLLDILSNGGENLATSRYTRGVESAVKNIKKTQDKILGMIRDRSIVNRLRWQRAKTLLVDIEAHKNTISMQATILTLAVVTKNKGYGC